MDPNKLNLKIKETEEYELLEEYTKFASEKIRDIFIAIKNNLNSDQWHLYSHGTPNGLLNVTFFNGILNILRFLIENNQVSEYTVYSNKLKGKNFHDFSFKNYKSSQYRKMGRDIYNTYFKQ